LDLRQSLVPLPELEQRLILVQQKNLVQSLELELVLAPLLQNLSKELLLLWHSHVRVVHEPDLSGQNF
jgi:hypothetical protein